MSAWMQVLTASSWGTLFLMLMRRFARSEVANLPVAELLRGNTKATAYLEREYRKHLAAQEQQREMYDLLLRDAERLRIRMQASGHWWRT